MKMLRILTILLFALFVNNAAAAPATVTGVVSDPSGAPLPNSSVEAVPIDNYGFVGNLTWTQTDDHGNFRLNLREGRYEIRGKKETDGYPDPNSLLSVDSKASFPEVVVSKRDIEGVQVRLGLKGGVLEGTVRDRTSHDFVQKAKITIRDAKRPQAYIELFTDKTGRFRFTVPCKPLIVSAVAERHQETHLDGGSEWIPSSGEHRTVIFELESK